MPIYDLKCCDCDTVFEALVRRPEDPVTCDNCQGSNVIKLVSRGTSFVLAGGGWYKDGYMSTRRDVK